MSAQTKRLIVGLVAVVVLWAATGLLGSNDDSDTTIASATETASGQAVEDPAPEDPAPEDPAPGNPEAGDTPTEANAAEEPTPEDPASSEQPSEAVERFSDLPTISPAELPLEAIDTLGLIAAGGPFPFSQDDTTFQNREAILPDHPRGHYREYTVITPGEGDRGARRIVAGADGALYYTADHYDSFREILLGDGETGQ